MPSYIDTLQRGLSDPKDLTRRRYSREIAERLASGGMPESLSKAIAGLQAGPWRAALGSDRDPTSSNPLRRHGGHLTGAVVQGLLFALLGNLIGRGIGGKHSDGPQHIGTVLGGLFGALPNLKEYSTSRDLLRPYVDPSGAVVPTDDVRTRDGIARHRLTGQRVFRNPLVDPATGKAVSPARWDITRDSEIGKLPTDLEFKKREYFR